jgi:PAS domain S-box-containing protein
MKSIISKLLISIGVIMALFLFLLLYASYTFTNKRIHEVVEQQASMALKFDLAIRGYVANYIRPVMYRLAGEEAFILETMSTSYVSRSIFEEVRNEFPEYIIKFSSKTPRNPINQAGPEEIKIIEYFDNNPHLKKWEGPITIGAKQYMAKFNARRMEESCLNCHGDPKDAPALLIEKYGSVAGFYQPMGKVIGMDTIAIPVAKITEKLWGELKSTFLLSFMGLVVFFVAVVLVIKGLIINRLILISKHFANAVAESNYSQINPIDIKGKDEIYDLAVGFNVLTDKLKNFYSSLNNQVKQRTASLEKVNEKLLQEINERKTTEKALRESEMRFKALHDASFGGIAIHDKGIIFDCNQGLSEITGYSFDELIGMDGLMLIAPEWRKTVMEYILSGFEQSYEAEGLRKDNTRFYLRIEAKNIPYHGRTLRVTEFRDITESRLAEKEKLDAQKIAAEQKQLVLVGQVSGKMAHDFNNILGIVMGNAELSLLGCKDEETKKTLELIFKQTLRGKNLTRNLVAFAKSQEPKQKFFKISDKINCVIDLLKKDLDGIEVVKKDEKDMPDLLADPGMIEHALVNLFQNSIHALGKIDRPKISIRTYCLEDDICFEIEDNGCGIPSEYLDKIYEPSFTLKGSKDVQGLYKEDIRGTGYGMANVKKYIEQHKGEVFVESEIRAGTKITVKIPVIKKELTEEEIIEIREEIACSGKHILLVEDESAISEVQYQVLTQEPCKHRVDTANNGQAAIELFDRNRYDFISLDYVLAGKISGMDVYDHIRKIDNTIPIMFVSGNLEFLESIKSLKQKDPYLDHLSKPCQNKDYVRSINELLEKNLAARVKLQ